MLRSGYRSDRQKLDDISAIVNELFSLPDNGSFYGELMLIDSICDVPLDDDQDHNLEGF